MYFVDKTGDLLIGVTEAIIGTSHPLIEELIDKLTAETHWFEHRDKKYLIVEVKESEI